MGSPDLLALIAKREAAGDKAGADRLRELHALIADAKARGRPTDCLERELEIQAGLAEGDIDRIQREEKRSGRPFFARPGRASWSTGPTPDATTAETALAIVGRQAARPRERRERRSYVRSGDSGGDSSDPPPRPRASGPRHIRHALADVGFDPFQRPLDRLLAGLRRHSPDSYRLVPGEGDTPDHWIARCPLHVDAGFTLVLSEAGRLWCRVGCPEGIIRYALVDDPERERAAESAARVIVWAQNWKRSA
jgi:hypothetical protein